MVWAAVLLSFYLLALSLVQQWMDAGGRLPTEWLLMLGFGLLSWVLWWVLGKSRDTLSHSARRRIILEEDAVEPAAPLPTSRLDVITK